MGSSSTTRIDAFILNLRGRARSFALFRSPVRSRENTTERARWQELPRHFLNPENRPLRRVARLRIRSSFRPPMSSALFKRCGPYEVWHFPCRPPRSRRSRVDCPSTEAGTAVRESSENGVDYDQGQGSPGSG